MEYYINKDKNVLKYVHDDGSETAIKTVAGCKTTNILTKKKNIDRNKYVIFISSSVGCPIKCKFCYLTNKKYPYYKLDYSQIILNVMDAIDHAIKIKPELKKKYVKLSFMGMGDIFLNFDNFDILVNDLTSYIIGNDYAKGIDGIDIATCLSKDIVNDYMLIKITNSFFKIKNHLKEFKINPLNNDRSIIRIFYSLHTFDDSLRKNLIPFSNLVKDDILFLEDIHYYNDVDIIFHQLFMYGINDDYSDIYEFIKYYETYKLKKFELRILQYNECPNTKIRAVPEKHFKQIIDILNNSIYKLKVQHSAGSEIKSACGQFLMKGLSNNCKL